MATATKKETEIKRLKSFKIYDLSAVDSKKIIDCATELLLANILEMPVMTAKTTAKMREIVMPAYKLIAPIILPIVSEADLKAENISNLSVKLNPSLGVWSFEIHYHMGKGIIQPYLFTVMAADTTNVFLRTLHKSENVSASNKFLSKV